MYLNLKLKDGIEPKELEKYGFVPKYDIDTGKVKEYQRKFAIDNNKDKYFKFILHTETKLHWFKRFEYESCMTGFNWSDAVNNDCMKMLYDLIINGIVEALDKEIYVKNYYR